VRALVRLILCLVVGAACGLLGGAIGLGIAGSSQQHTTAGDAKVTVKIGQPAGLTLISLRPAAELSLRPWTVPLIIQVTPVDTDPDVLVRAVVDTDARTALERSALDALARAAGRAALAALVGALILGLMGGLAVSALTGARRHTLLVALIAVLTAGAPVAVGVAQVAQLGTTALQSPTCPVAPEVSLPQAAQAVGSPQAEADLARSVAIRAACSPSFQSELLQAISGR
jgi:hypothetical protein